jgi:ATP-dependent helicase/nuclease subunit B
MDWSSALPQHIADALAHGANVLTANQRAARTLLHDFNLRQRSRGLAFWEPPAILAWDAWLTSLWHQLLLQGEATDLLLSSTQEHTLWRALIADDVADTGLQPIDALAQTAAEAWLLLHQYRSRARLSAFPGNSDTRAFANWAAEFDRRCTRSGYRTYAQLPETLRAATLAGHLALPSSLLLVGFDSNTPAQVALLDAIRSSGRSITEPAPSPAPPAITLADAPDEYAEIAACARWIRSRLTQHPSSRIAVIVPAIDSCRAEIDRHFRSILAPELDNIAAPSSAGPYEFSLGVPLAHTPLAATALETLRWAIGPLPIERVSTLLLSPFFAAPTAAQDELLARAEFDAFAVRQQHLLQPSMTVDQLQRLASSPRWAATLPALLKHLRPFALLAEGRNLADATRTSTGWAEAFHHLLDAAGFAPPAQLDSVQFQARRKWESALDELATLDFDPDAPPLNFAAALEALARIAEDMLFAPESRHAPVQIMGPLESAGSTFDATWFLRANDLAWPTVSSPNPLLPWPMQRELRMPGADPAHDARYARGITQRIAASAPDVVFSYALQSAEGHQRPSSSLAGIPALASAASELAASPPSRAPITLDTLIDDAPIPCPPDRVLHGGASILQAQAACGFRAFAEKRLFSSAPDSLSLGLDSAERGSLIHAVLEDFWAVVKTQAALRQMTSAERSGQLNRSIELALHRHHARPSAGWARSYLDAERQRLNRLLTRFLDYEAASRRPFTVMAREQQLSGVRIGPLRLDVRVDRIDTVDLRAEDGTAYQGEIIIDYKTGKTNPSDWLDRRPDEPQLPLYAVVSESPQLVAIAFATVRPGKDMGLRGYHTEDGALPKSSRFPTPTLADQVTAWRDVLESLADDFYHGNASVSPKQYPKTCAYCAQRLLCRLDPSTLSAATLEDETELDLAAEADLG